MNRWQFGVEVVRIFADRDRPVLAFAAFLVFMFLLSIPLLVAAWKVLS
jgi:hypothetical protein